MSDVFEVQCDGLVGPTHNYAGLSHGNVASAHHAKTVSNPRAAALQGLAKMRFVASLGVRQLVLPPQPRPNFPLLHSLGFGGSEAEALDKAAQIAPAILAAAYSSSSMWAANAATVSPSADSADGRLHLSVANLGSTLHRAQEAAFTEPLLRFIFGKAASIHSALPVSLAMTDEGAANHMRLADPLGAPGLEIFVYGRASGGPSPARFPARQTRDASEAVARRHGLCLERTLFLQQHPAAIDAGVFHNDVIAMSHGPLLVHHAQAFFDPDAGLRIAAAAGSARIVSLSEAALPLEAAVKSYFFNSQLVSREGGGIAIIAPAECEETPSARAALERLRDANDIPVQEIHYLDVRESMKNGGGPACLRLRVPMTEIQWQASHPAFRFSDALEARLSAWIGEYYRDRVTLDDLRDPLFAREAANAYEALSKILPLPPIG